ncbi:MAG: MOFRL family protein [Vicinamibacteria bacterium]
MTPWPGLMWSGGRVRGAAALPYAPAGVVRVGVSALVVDADGRPVLLLEQDRGRWDRLLIRRGLAALARAEALGYAVAVMEEPVTGEARSAAPDWLVRARRLAESLPRPACVLSSGETTVTVTGTGRGGRNQEFTLALASPLAALDAAVVAASVGTDGIDGPTDAAGALVDPTTLTRARAAGLPAPDEVLRRNDSHAFFAGLDDLIRTGPTATNVGDVQALLIG